MYIKGGRIANKGIATQFQNFIEVFLEQKTIIRIIIIFIRDAAIIYGSGVKLAFMLNR